MKLLLVAMAVMAAAPGQAAETLSGDTRLACEAVLCLSSGLRPGECSPSLERYFGINHKKWKDTVSARRDFLNQCPSASEPGMPSLVEAIVNGAGRCNASTLNSTLVRWVEIEKCDGTTFPDPNASYDERGCRTVTVQVIDDTLPGYCKAYSGHEWTWKVGVRYQGELLNGGKWVDAP